MEMDYPKTRMDNFFAKAAGSELADNSMEPITDREYWINEMAAKIAQGGGGGGGGCKLTVVELSYDEGTGVTTASMTAGKMFDACQQGLVLFSYSNDDSGNVIEVVRGAYDAGPGYCFIGTITTLTADTADDYPSSGGIS